MRIYEKEEKLELKKQIWVTEAVYDILRKAKRKEKMSMSKLVCNAIIKKYGEEDKKIQG
jgi:predicted CopG family antitoxin